jgi:hypothetical protein
MGMNNFHERWIGHGGPQALATSPPDLNPMNLVMGPVKRIVYAKDKFFITL